MEEDDDGEEGQGKSSYISKPSNAIHLCLVIFQLEKQKRLERIRQKRAQLEELILQVCSTPVCVCLCVSVLSRQACSKTSKQHYTWESSVET